MSKNIILDTLIIGAGPAGLSAAIYLSRFNRQVLVIDRGHGRTESQEINQNYLGFPEGIHSTKLVELGKTQAASFGAIFISGNVEQLVKTDDLFSVNIDGVIYTGKSVILATGVKDLYPNIPNALSFLGTSLFWCITCDGFKSIGKKVVVVGDSDEAACTALQFLQFTPRVEFVTNYEAGSDQISQKWRHRLDAAGIKLWESTIEEVTGERGQIKHIKLANGTSLQPDLVFSMQGAIPNITLASQLNVTINGEGYIETDDEQRTNVPFVYAAGDVTRRFSHQIVTAVHEGSMAAQAANYDLYQDFQRMD